jgi:hypothetical protein
MQKAMFQEGKNTVKTPQAWARCGVSNRKSDDSWLATDDQNFGGFSGGVYGTLPSP